MSNFTRCLQYYSKIRYKAKEIDKKSLYKEEKQLNPCSRLLGGPGFTTLSYSEGQEEDGVEGDAVLRYSALLRRKEEGGRVPKESKSIDTVSTSSHFQIKLDTLNQVAPSSGRA